MLQAADPATLGNILPLPCDVADSAAVVAAVARVEAELGAIDVLVLNAAVGHPPKPFWETSIDDVDSVIDVNLKGVMYTAHAVLQGMIQRDRGHIFGIASVAGTHGIPTQSICALLACSAADPAPPMSDPACTLACRLHVEARDAGLHGHAG
jgi:NAD(P)-dependent dehydrogenase (short-subunit alcohol dehydrogenase family)